MQYTHVENDPNYQLGCTRARLAVIAQLADQLMDGPAPDDPTEWSLFWDRIAQIRQHAHLEA